MGGSVPEYWLLNQSILPVLSQPWFKSLATKRKPVSLTLEWNEEDVMVMEFDQGACA